MATDTSFVPTSAIDRFTQLMRLRQLVDEGAVYVPQSLNLSQFRTLRAVLDRVLPEESGLAADLDAGLANGSDSDIAFPLRAFDYQLGLDELDSLARTRTGFAFADLTAELQDALLSLVASRDLTTRRLDLSLWLNQLYSNAAASLVSD